MDYKDLLNKLIEKGQEKMDEVEAFLVKTSNWILKSIRVKLTSTALQKVEAYPLGAAPGKMDIPTLKGWKNLLDSLVDEALENSKYIEGLMMRLSFQVLKVMRK